MKCVISVLGKDTTGIVAEVAVALRECGANIDDISQTLLGDIFSMTMIVTLKRAPARGGRAHRRAGYASARRRVPDDVQDLGERQNRPEKREGTRTGALSLFFAECVVILQEWARRASRIRRRSAGSGWRLPSLLPCRTGRWAAPSPARARPRPSCGACCLRPSCR